MIKKLGVPLLLVLACVFSTVHAQTVYDLYQMTDQEFQKGGNSVWSFERYEKATGKYAPFTIYGDSGRINQADNYNPYRFGGELKGNAKAGTTGHQKMGYDPDIYSLYSHKDEFVYVGTKSAKYEMLSTKDASTALVFTVPAEGYYRLDMSVQCQDSDTKGLEPYPLLVNRYRYSSAEDINYVDPQFNMGLNISYAQGGITVPKGEAHPVTGEIMSTERRWYTPFDPEDYSICFFGKAGDKLTIELTVDGSAAWDGCWIRSRFHALKATTITEEEAKKSTRYANPYATADLTKINEIYAEAQELYVYVDAHIGAGVGEYPYDAFQKFDVVLTEFVKVKNAGMLTGMNIQAWEVRLQEAIDELKGAEIVIDWREHYRLFPYDDNNTHFAWFKEQVDKPEDATWKFFSYANASGLYTKIANYDVITNYTAAEGWSDASEWFYIASDGAVHPLKDKQPAIIFTAPEEGYYLVSESIQRTQKNNKYTMYMRNRYIPAEVGLDEMIVHKESYIMAKPFGGAESGDGTNPADATFYVKLKKGDRLTFEQDCYTPNNNGSANSQWLRLEIANLQTVYGTPEEILEVISKDVNTALIDPFVAGDFSGVSALIDEYKEFLSTVQVGDKVGQYSELAHATFSVIIERAEEMVTEGIAPDYKIVVMENELKSAYETFIGQLNYTLCTPNGEGSAKLASGLYYVKVDGLYITVPANTTKENGDMVLDYKLPNPDNAILNRQVWRIDFNTNEHSADPARYTLVSDTSEVWASREDGRIHFDESGKVKFGNTEFAQSEENSNNTWRNHSIYFNGTSYAIYNVVPDKHSNSIVFKGEKNENGTIKTTRSVQSGTKVFIYELVKIEDDISSVNTLWEESTAVVYGGQGTIIVKNAQTGDRVEIYDLLGNLVKKETVSGSDETICYMEKGLYVVRVAGTNSVKVIVQ